MAAVLSVDLVMQLAAGAMHAVMPEHMLWIEDMATGAWVAGVAKDLGVTVSYDKLPCSPRTCNVSHAVTTSFYTPEAMHCAHGQNGRCCETWQPRLYKDINNGSVLSELALLERNSKSAVSQV